MDEKKSGKIEKNEFISAMQREPDLLEIFDFLNRGGKYIFTNEEVEKREHDEKINRKIIKLEKDLKKINEFLHENFPMNEIMDKFTEKNFINSPITSPMNQKPKITHTVSTKTERISFMNMNQILMKEEIKEELKTPMRKTTRKSVIDPRVHGFEKNMVKILNDVDRLSPEILGRNDFDFEVNQFVLQNNEKERFTMENVRPESINLSEVTKKEFNYLMQPSPNKKDPGYISQIIINDEQMFDGEDSKVYSSKKNFTFNNSDLYARPSFGSEKKEQKNIRYEKSLSNDVGKDDEKGKLKGTLLLSFDKSPINKMNDKSPISRMDKITNTALVLKEMLEITKEIREDYDKNAIKFIEKNKEK